MRVCDCVRLWVYVCVCLCECVSVHVCMCVRVCVHICMCEWLTLRDDAHLYGRICTKAFLASSLSSLLPSERELLLASSFERSHWRNLQGEGCAGCVSLSAEVDKDDWDAAVSK